MSLDNKNWTQFAIDAEVDCYGTKRICEIHNQLKRKKKKLTAALKAARDHLEYCGYGDSWERSCALESGLSKLIDDALGE